MVLPQTEATSSAKEQKCDRPRYVTQIYSSTFFIPLQDFTQIFSCKGVILCGFIVHGLPPKMENASMPEIMAKKRFASGLKKSPTKMTNN